MLSLVTILIVIIIYILLGLVWKIPYSVKSERKKMKGIEKNACNRVKWKCRTMVADPKLSEEKVKE